MLNKICNFILCFNLALLLAGCSALPDWLAAKEDTKKEKGERISVLKVGTSLNIDSSLANTPVNLPKQVRNEKWYKSGSQESFTPQNIMAPRIFDEKDIVRIGHASSREHHIGATPLVAEGKIFTVDSRGLVRAFDAHNIRDKIWAYEIEIEKGEGDFSSSGMLYHKGKLYITTGYNKIIALSAKDGSLVWERSINSVARSAPAASDNIVMVNTIDNKLYALNANDGAIEWVHSGVAEDLSVFGAASPVAHGQIVFAPYSSGELYALKLSDGSEIWSEDLTLSNANISFSMADIDASPIISGDNIYVISSDGVLASINIYSGQRVWYQEISGSKTPWLAGDFLYLLSENNEVICVNAKTGGVKWVERLPSYKKEENKSGPITWNGPIIVGDNLILIGSHGEMLSLSPGNGETLHSNKIPKNVYLPPIAAYDSIYLISDKGQLVKLTGNIDPKKDTATKKHPTPKAREDRKKGFWQRLFGN